MTEVSLMSVSLIVQYRVFFGEIMKLIASEFRSFHDV